MISNEDADAVEKIRRELPVRNVSIVLLKNADGRFLFVRTKRVRNHWQPVGGGLEDGDTSFEEAALREVAEEAGVTLQSNDLSFVCDADYDFGTGTIRFFQAQLPLDAHLEINKDEIEEHRWLTLHEAQALPIFPAVEKCLAFMIEHMS